jgi:hypothetical protein
LPGGTGGASHMQSLTHSVTLGLALIVLATVDSTRSELWTAVRKLSAGNSKTAAITNKPIPFDRYEWLIFTTFVCNNPGSLFSTQRRGKEGRAQALRLSHQLKRKKSNTKFLYETKLGIDKGLTTTITSAAG